MVDSTALARQLDPEDYREVVRAYQATCAAVIQRFDGYIAQYLGDGLLVYFGYPQAHEDDAQRAVRAGLEMLDALARYRRGWRRTKASGWQCAWAFIRDWWWSVLWGQAGGRSSWPWETHPMWRPGSRAWRRQTRWSSVTRPGAWCRDILLATTLAHRPSRGWRTCPGISGARERGGVG